MGRFAGTCFQDAADPARIVEVFLVESWVEHLRQHERVTQADRIIQGRLLSVAILLLLPAPGVPRRVERRAAERGGEPRRQRGEPLVNGGFTTLSYSPPTACDILVNLVNPSCGVAVLARSLRATSPSRGKSPGLGKGFTRFT